VTPGGLVGSFPEAPNNAGHGDAPYRPLQPPKKQG
jgi:hypothetical protein